MITENQIQTGPSAPLLLLAHGAGAGMSSPFMNSMADALADVGIGVLRFNFPYMTKMEAEGRRRPPDRQAVLREAWHAVIDQQGAAGKVFIGGKSMGGRMATLVACERPVAGVVALGYPFHPQGKPEKLRTEHLPDLRAPLLIVQGERDPFGTPAEVASYELPEGVDIFWLPDGNHDFQPRKRSGHSQQGLIELAAKRVGQFVTQQMSIQQGSQGIESME